MKLAIALSALFAVAACVAPAPPEPAGTPIDPDPTRFGRYECKDGSTVDVAYGDDSATLRIKGDAIPMTIAISASGARYIGGGWQWWTKGSDFAMLAPLAPGETYASARGVDCTSP